MNFKERIINGLYGQAVADAVGNPFEFKDDINPLDVINYANCVKKLTVTDDTQMCLFGFDAIQNVDQFSGRNYTTQLTRSLTKSYVDWFDTQNTSPHNHLDHVGGLLSFRSMWSTQSPGFTCLDSLEAIKSGEIVDNDSMGCGSVMRLLPMVSLLQDHSLVDVIDLARISGNITHKHYENAVAIRLYIDAAHKIVNNLLFGNDYVGVTHITQLGDGWTALSCVNMAIWSYHTANSFDELLQLSVAHGGDSDSVAAVAGSLWGLSGREVPIKYIQKLDALDAIQYTISTL